MDIEDFINQQKDYSIGNVKSKKDADDITLDRATWGHLLAADPVQAEFIAGHSGFDEQEIRFLVEILDTVAQNNVRGMNVADGTREDAETVRKRLIEEEIKSSK